MTIDVRPHGRIHDQRDAVLEALPEIIDPDNFTPRLVAILSNALVARESSLFRQRFGLGTNEWRVLSVLATQPGSSAREVADFLVVDAAQVSRSAGTLIARGLILLSSGPRGSRPMYLTSDGAEMHDEMLPIALRGQSIVLEEFTAEEIAAMNGYLRRMLAKAPELLAEQRARRAEMTAASAEFDETERSRLHK